MYLLNNSFRLFKSTSYVGLLIKGHFNIFRFISTSQPRILTHPVQNNSLSPSLNTRDYCSAREPEDFKKRNELLLDIFLKNGFNCDQFAKLVEKCPEIECLNFENLNTTLNVWKQCNFGESKLVSLIIKLPDLLLAKPKQVTRLYNLLYSKFEKKDMYTLIFNSPSLVFENTKLIEERLDYLLNFLNLSSGKLVRSSALCYPLNHIKTRYKFLICAGLFKIFDKKTDILEKIKNPNIDDVITTSDEYFATKVTKLSSLEYEVFKELYEDDDGDSN